MSAPASRPVHPCVLSLTEGTRGAEYSTWAFITTRRPDLPNLVTASASTLTVYSVQDATGKLRLEHTFANLAGSVVFLESLSRPDDAEQPAEQDALLIGFAGHPRLAVVKVNTADQQLLQAVSLLDLTPALHDASYGATTPLEVDAIMTSVSSRSSGLTTAVACVLGGGVAVAVVEVAYHKSVAGWLAQEPYILPLPSLSSSLPHNMSSGMGGAAGAAGAAASNMNLGQSMSTGFGDIVSATFLSGYLEPVLVLLHSDPGGRIFPGRLGRQDEEEGAPPLYATALSVSVTHQRTALLWCREVSADAFLVSSFAKTKCVVVGANTLIVLNAAGNVQCVLAVNGWARATCPASLQNTLQPNPIAKLAVSLDGCALAWVSPQSAILSLRTGEVYVFQQMLDKQWTLLPTGSVLGGIGEVEDLTALPLADEKSQSPKFLDKVAKTDEVFMGLVFAGSRLGNSLLLAYALESIKMHVNSQVKAEPRATVKQELETQPTKQEIQSTMSPAIDEEHERLLRMEEEALYAPTIADQKMLEPDLIPPSDDEVEASGTASQRKHQRLSAFTVVRGLIPLDSLINLGPLGRSCFGPLSSTPKFLKDELHLPPGSAEPEDVFGMPAYVFPAGFGSSGGIALATLPGRDGRMIYAEEDCLNVDSVFSLPINGLVLLGMSQKAGNGIRVLRLVGSSSDQDNEGNEGGLNEVDINEWCGGSSSTISGLFRATLLGAGEFPDGSFVVLLNALSSDGIRYVVVVMKETNGVLGLTGEAILDSKEGDFLLQVTPFVQNTQSNGEVLSFVCIWASGKAEVVSVSSLGNRFVTVVGVEDTELELDNAMDIDENEDEDEREMKQFYKDQRIVSVDMFKGPKALFMQRLPPSESTPEHRFEQSNECSFFDEDDEDLYGLSSRSTSTQPNDEESRAAQERDAYTWNEEATYVAVCRQSGKLQVYVFGVDGKLQPCWVSSGCGQGVMQLQEDDNSYRLPRSRKISVREMRFFTCGSSLHGGRSDPEQHVPVRSFCLALETSSGDVQLYVFQQKCGPPAGRFFNKVLLKSVFRQSQEQTRHYTKLVRKGIIGIDDGSSDTSFCYNHLHRFYGISGQDGLFAACSRPAWFLAERGRPTVVFHRTRHAAPAGGSPRPVSGFCSGLNIPKSGNGGFLTVHERVGRFGSKRLTAFHGLSKIFSHQGFLSGCHGLCIEKIPMGVTVRKIEFINDESVSTGDHPLYAVLVSREIDADQSMWNSDGLTPEERKRQQEEEENAKIQKQVEADLGGFDMESEWVEEIEREDCFKVDVELGGAPPLRKQAYSLWIVDAANKWMVVDSFEFDDFEHAMTLNIVNLSDFPEEPGAASSDVGDGDLSTQLFISVGTGYVDHNGEDVSSKGRVLLFEVKKPDGAMKVTSSQVAELSLVYEKLIFHGPVTSISCLSTEGGNRLVVGAGCDVNIEQWGNSKLTQVGFFRATMQILDILLFKNFFLLSDAYDSLYFLVWRESDKSLTLLAKDYDPIPVYAAGQMSRGAAMTFICHDDRQNLQFFQYAPGEAAARGGNKLVCRADFHLGSQTTAFSSHFCRSSLLVHSATPTSTLTALKQQDAFFGRTDDDQKLGALFGTTDGGLGAVVPLSEPVYWRLTALQSVMANALEGDCALSPRAWRLYRRTPRRGGCRSNDRKKGVIDGDLIVRYADLPRAHQEDLASAIGTTVELILDNILELQCGSMIM